MTRNELIRVYTGMLETTKEQRDRAYEMLEHKDVFGYDEVYCKIECARYTALVSVYNMIINDLTDMEM